MNDKENCQNCNRLPYTCPNCIAEQYGYGLVIKEKKRCEKYAKYLQ